MLAATPLLLLVQMLLLPLFLALFADERLHAVVSFKPFLYAFVWLIALPLPLAAVVQLWAARGRAGPPIREALGGAVPATAVLLFLVIASVVPRLGEATGAALMVLSLCVAFAVIAPFIGWFVARVFRLDAVAARKVAFSAATRNSLVVLSLAYAASGTVPLLPALIVTQTLVELASELLYVRVLPAPRKSVMATALPFAGRRHRGCYAVVHGWGILAVLGLTLLPAVSNLLGGRRRIPLSLLEELPRRGYGLRRLGKSQEARDRFEKVDKVHLSSAGILRNPGPYPVTVVTYRSDSLSQRLGQAADACST